MVSGARIWCKNQPCQPVAVQRKGKNLKTSKSFLLTLKAVRLNNKVNSATAPPQARLLLTRICCYFMQTSKINIVFFYHAPKSAHACAYTCRQNRKLDWGSKAASAQDVSLSNFRGERGNGGELGGAAAGACDSNQPETAAATSTTAFGGEFTISAHLFFLSPRFISSSASAAPRSP